MPAKKQPEMSRGDKVIGWIQNLKITIGKDIGKNFILRPWQQDFIRDVYDPVHPKGNRKVRRAILSMARKNGKTEIAATLILAHLCGPEAEQNGEIYSAANDREQAAIVFNACVRMIEGSKYLSSMLKVVKSTKTIFVRKTGVKGEGSKFRALSADAGTKHGLNPSLVVYDELAQTKNRELFDTLTTSQGARAEPLFIVISTQNNDPSHVLSEMIDDAMKVDARGNKVDESIVCHLYAADDDCDVLDEAQWAKANPALGDFRDEDELRAMAHRAKRLPSEENSFRLLYLNQRVSIYAGLIPRSSWKACQEPVEAPYVIRGYSNNPETREVIYGEPCYLGLDMSMTTDLTALSLVSAENGSRIRGWYWKPNDLIEEHTKRDRVRYDLWQKDGWLENSPGPIISRKQVAEKIAELWSLYDIRGLAYDRWKIQEVLVHFDEIGLQTYVAKNANDVGYGLKLVPWGQGMGDMSPAVLALEEAVLSKELVHDNNPLTNMCVLNAMTEMDPSGNRKLNKEKSRFRIDGAVALAMALGLKARDRGMSAPTNPWADPNFKVQVL